jgi:hypothetical protein
MRMNAGMNILLSTQMPELHQQMTIDLREDFSALRNYVSQVVVKHLEKGKPMPRMIHFGFTFDQDGWISAYLDTRPNASRDGEWTKHLVPETLLPRPLWYEASELSDLSAVNLIGMEGERMPGWSSHPALQNFANILGDFIKLSVATFDKESLFRRLLDGEQLIYCVEEFTGLYGWPLAPEMSRLADSLRILQP